MELKEGDLEMIQTAKFFRELLDLIVAICVCVSASAPWLLSLSRLLFRI